MQVQVPCMHMQTPSIESIFARTHDEKSFPIAKHLHDAPLVGGMARTWMRTMRNAQRASLWVSLPPVARA